MLEELSAELLAEPVLDSLVKVEDWLGAVAWLPGLLRAATQPKPSVPAMLAKVTARVVVRRRRMARPRSAGVRRRARCMARMVANRTFRTDYGPLARSIDWKARTRPQRAPAGSARLDVELVHHLGHAFEVAENPQDLVCDLE